MAAMSASEEKAVIDDLCRRGFLLEHVGTVRSGKKEEKKIWVGNPKEIRLLAGQVTTAKQLIIHEICWFSTNEPKMDHSRWLKIYGVGTHNVIMSPEQWRSFRSWADEVNDWTKHFVSTDNWKDWGDSPPLYARPPKWPNKNAYVKAKSFGVLRIQCDARIVDKWYWSDCICQAEVDRGGTYKVQTPEKYNYIYDLQPDGRWKLRNPEQYEGTAKTMSETKTEVEILSTAKMFSKAFQEGGKMATADRINKILCGQGIRRALVKLGASEEFLKSPLGEIFLKSALPGFINEGCVRGFVPSPAFVSSACQKAMDVNTLDAFRLAFDKLSPALTALAEVGKELVEEQEEETKKAAEDGSQPPEKSEEAHPVQ